MKALLGVLHFVEDIIQNEERRDFLINLIFEAVRSADPEIRNIAVQCLVRYAENYYNFLNKYMQQIWTVKKIFIIIPFFRKILIRSTFTRI